MAIVELEEFKGYVNVTRAEKDELLQQILDGAIAFAGGTYTKRALEPLDGVAEVRRRLDGSRFIRVPDAREVTEVALDGTELVAEDEYELLESPGSAATTVTIEVFRRGRVAVVTGSFGMAEVPEDLRDSILALAARRYWQRAAGQSDSVQSEEYGVATYFRAMPAEVRVVLDTYRVGADRHGL